MNKNWLWCLPLLIFSLLGTLSVAGKTQAHADAITPVIAAAGDIACDPVSTSPDGPYFGIPNGPDPTHCQMGSTADLITSDPNIDRVLPLGDDQYMNGTLTKFMGSYDKTWGAFKAITSPAPGNHEWATGNVSGYSTYFGLGTTTWYSFNLGDWHIVSLDSNCSRIGGCTASSPEGQFLQGDLGADAHLCQLLYWHHPHFSSTHKSGPTGAFWNIAYQHGVDVILNGHIHSYERFAPQTPKGTADPIKGIREFVVGTGGEDLGQEGLLYPKATSQVFNNTSFGVLKMTLQPSGYSWMFDSAGGSSFTDSGTDACH